LLLLPVKIALKNRVTKTKQAFIVIFYIIAIFPLLAAQKRVYSGAAKNHLISRSEL